MEMTKQPIGEKRGLVHADLDQLSRARLFSLFLYCIAVSRLITQRQAGKF